MLHGHHDIKAYHAAFCPAPGLLQFLSHGAQIRFHRICIKIRLPETDLGGGDGSCPACGRHSARQAAQAYSYAHTALKDGTAQSQVADL